MIEYLDKKARKKLSQQLREILQKKRLRGKKLDWKRFFGKVKFEEDPVSYQRRLRDEWE